MNTFHKSGIFTLCVCVVGAIFHNIAVILALVVGSVLGAWCVYRLERCTGYLKTDYLIIQCLQLKDHVLSLMNDLPNKTTDENSTTPTQELKILTEYILQDFVRIWYKEVSDCEQFPEDISCMLDRIVNELTHQLSRCSKNKYILIEQCVNTYREHLCRLQMSRDWLKKMNLVEKYKVENLNTCSHNKISDSEAFSQVALYHISFAEQNTYPYLHAIVDTLFTILVPNSYVKCSTGKDLIVDILCLNVMKKVVNLITDSFFLHKAIILILSDEELDIEKQKILNSDTTTYKRSDSFVSQTHNDNLDPNKSQRKIYGNIQSEHVPLLQSKDVSASLPNIVDDISQTTSPFNYSQEKNCASLSTSLEGSLSPSMCEEKKNKEPKEATGEQQTFVTEELAKMFRVTLPKNITSDVPNLEKHETSCTSYQSITCSNNMCERLEAEGMSFTDNGNIHSTMSEYESSSSIRPHNLDIPCFNNEPTIGSSHNDVEENPQVMDRPVAGVHDEAAPLPPAPAQIFCDVTIPKTESAKEPGGLSVYTLYCVHVVSIHIDNSGQSIQKQQEVKRRYREFLTLQERLEKHPILKRVMKGIPGPSRWKVFPLGNLEGGTVLKRQSFLEKYLQTLIASPEVGTSLALKEFLAYDGNANIAFVCKVSDIRRIDKMLVKTVTGVFDKLSSVLPSLPEDKGFRSPTQSRQRGQSAPKPETIVKDWEDDDEIHVQLSIQEPSDPECLSRSILWRQLRKNGRLIKTEVFDSDSDNAEGMTMREDGDGCDSEDMSTDCLPESSLATAVLDLAAQTLATKETPISRDRLVHVIRTLMARALESWLHLEIDTLTSSERIARYLQLLKDSIWPDGRPDTGISHQPTEEEKIVTRNQARRCLAQFFPFFLPWLVGQDEFNHGMDEILLSLDDPILNKHLLMCITDQVIEVVFPEILTKTLQAQLLKNTPRHNPEADDSPSHITISL